MMRCLAYILLFLAAPCCFAQVITVRIVNTQKSEPVPKQRMSVSLLYDKEEKRPANLNAAFELETGNDGTAQFQLPEPPPEHLSVGIHVDWGHWNCGGACIALVITQDVVQKGIVRPGPGGGKSPAIQPTPGMIVFLFRPLSFFERLWYPLLKG
jgi:hypothetical protein